MLKTLNSVGNGRGKSMAHDVVLDSSTKWMRLYWTTRAADPISHRSKPSRQDESVLGNKTLQRKV